MNFNRTRFSAVIAWGMIPLAAWAGLPSTACVCANGRIKLVCKHLASGGAGCTPAEHESHCELHCCGMQEILAEAGSDHEAGCDHEADCCGAGQCSRNSDADQSGIASKACCKPLLSAPSAVSEAAKVSCDHAPALAAAVEEVGALVHPSFAPAPAELDTGPPLDRVIVYRSLLI